MVSLMWIVSIVIASGVLILLYNILEYFMWDNSFTITLICIVSIIVSLVVGGLFWGVKGTYEVVDVKNYPYMQQIIIKDDNNNIYLMPVKNGQRYQVGNEVELSMVDVELKGNNLN